MSEVIWLSTSMFSLTFVDSDNSRPFISVADLENVVMSACCVVVLRIKSLIDLKDVGGCD